MVILPDHLEVVLRSHMLQDFGRQQYILNLLRKKCGMAMYGHLALGFKAQGGSIV